MDGEPKSGEWTRKDLNILVKDGISPFGLSRKEKVDLRSGRKTITDTSDNVCRVIREWGEGVSEDPNLKEFHKRYERLFRQDSPNFINLSDPNTGEFVSVAFLKGGETIRVYLIEQKIGNIMGLEDSPKAHESDGSVAVSLEYNKDGLAKCYVQVERTTLDVELQDADFSTAVNYIKTSENPSELEDVRHANEEFFSELVQKEYGGDNNNPRVLEARGIASQIINELVQRVPFDDRVETERAVESVGWETALTLDLLRKADGFSTIADFLKKEGKDAVVRQSIKDEIWVHSPRSPESAHKVEIKNFSEGSFDWAEIEVDNAGQTLDDISDLDIKLPEDRKAIFQAEGAAYGNTIKVLGNSIVVGKEGKVISIVFSRGTKKQWRTEFPLSVPFENIVQMGKDSSVDFRTLGSFLQTSLSKK